MLLRNLILIFLLTSSFGFSQLPKLSDKAEISVMTCAGDPSVLYYAFGHTAIRVQDPELNIDVVYNYGTFDFNQPNFYLNFTKGRLLYTLSRRRFDTFLIEYEMEERWVRQQVLNLTPEEMNDVFQYLEHNFLPENRDYLYDPLFDNCSTVINRILADNFGEEILYGQPNDETLSEEISGAPTFRQLVRSHLKINSWGSFGIDLAFGGVVDRKASLQERMFLPYQALYQIREAKKGEKALLAKEEIVLDFEEKKDTSSFFTSPLFFYILLLIAIAYISYKDWQNNYRRRWLDFTLLFISGLAGIFLLFLWFGTDHVYTKNNWNILWLFPLNFFIAFVVVQKKPIAKWVKKYLWIAVVLMELTIILWVFKVQIFSPLNLVLMAILGIRFWFMLKCKAA